MPGKRSRYAAKSAFAIFFTLLLASVFATQPAQARKFKVLHTFHGKDGANPAGVLVRDVAGNLYGTTAVGGTGKCAEQSCGTAFKMSKDGKEVWRHNFNSKCSSGTCPPTTTAMYVLGESIGGGYSRFATTPSPGISTGSGSTVVPTWGVGSTPGVGSCTTPGALYSNTQGVTGNAVFVCTGVSSFTWKPIP